MIPIIQSILDNDLYSFTQQQAILQCHPNVQVTYEFNNRRKSDRFNGEFLNRLRKQIDGMQELSLQTEETRFLFERCPFLSMQYLQYLKSYRFNPKQVQIFFAQDGDLKIHIEGPWYETVLWEVPLLALVSEIYFNEMHTHWEMEGQEENILEKSRRLENCPAIFSEFGTRRRRSYSTQDLIVRCLKSNPYFMGTSNVHLAQSYGLRPMGTMSHQWIMAASAIHGLRHANRFALQDWNRVFQGNLGIALTDTFGTDAFLQDFDGVLARLFDGVRQDSGPLEGFVDKIVAHYQKLRIDPLTKTILFSDGLDIDTVERMVKYCANKVKCAFGIGTNLTNDFPDKRALNIVIKLRSVDGVEVVKISDVATKATGDRDALRVARYTFFGTPLDATDG